MMIKDEDTGTVILYVDGFMRILGCVAVILPLILILLSKKFPFWNKRPVKLVLLILYTAIICTVTLFIKSPGDIHQINLIPFWSYQNFVQDELRWQIFMNVFLFIPFGFLLPFSRESGFVRTLLIGLAFSVTIEMMQYIFCLGLCEFDDVFHNTLGTVIGYWYYRGLDWITEKMSVRKTLKCKKDLSE